MMNDLIFQLHTPEELRLLSSVGHWIAGSIFLVVAVIAFLQTRGLLKTKPYLWQSIVVIGGLFFIPYLLLHHSLNEFPLVWKVIFLDPQQRQHFIMFNLITLGGITELLISLKKLRAKIFHFVFPTVVVIIGLMFLFHPQHGTSEALAYSVPYHTLLGTVLLMAGLAKTVQVIWSERYKLWKYVWIIFLFISALMLLSYNEPAGTYEAEINHTVIPRSDSSNSLGNSSFIENLRQMDFEPSQIAIENTIASNDTYTGYLFSYQSEGLKIYGRMNVPVGAGPFPVVILNHGYFNQSSFTSGDGTQTMADILARNGYLTLASDYRGFGKSENDAQGSRGHNPNYAIDVLSLVASIGNVEKADPMRVGMWGHSMGGEVSLRTIEATDKVKTVVLWAPTSTNRETNSSFYGGSRHSTQGEEAHNDNDLAYINTPISLHQGLSDTEVDPEWSKELNADLGKLDKQVEYFEYPGQDHNFRNLGWDVISKRTVDFFDKYLK